MNACNFGSGQNIWVDLSVFSRWGYHDQGIYTGDKGWDAVHKHRGGIRGLTAGHIEANSLQRRNVLPKGNARTGIIHPGFLFLLFVKSADVACGFLNDSGHLPSCKVKSLLDFSVGHTQGIQTAAVNFFSIVYKRCIALGFDGVDDFQNTAADFLILALIALEKCVELVNAFFVCVSFHGILLN